MIDVKWGEAAQCCMVQTDKAQAEADYTAMFPGFSFAFRQMAKAFKPADPLRLMRADQQVAKDPS